MLKSIIKAVATPARLSSYAADGIQRGVNGTKEETAATVAKYATITNEIGEHRRRGARHSPEDA